MKLTLICAPLNLGKMSPEMRGELVVYNDVGKVGTWLFVSGPHGRGHLPAGRYAVKKAVAVSEQAKPYCDPEGLAWFAPLAPDFHTDRTGLGIHPDGNVEGTLGCIGIEGPTEPLFNLLHDAEAATLYVI